MQTLAVLVSEVGMSGSSNSEDRSAERRGSGSFHFLDCDEAAVLAKKRDRYEPEVVTRLQLL